MHKPSYKSLLPRIKALPVSDVISAYVDLKHKGRGRYLCLCPFHDEKTPSFWVDDDRGGFHCFGCGAHGDAVAFVMRICRLSFADAVERVAGVLRIDDYTHQPAPVRQRAARTAEDQIYRAQREAEKAAAIWRAAGDITGTAGEVYFREHRRIRIARLPEGRLPVSLRFSAAHEYWTVRAGGRLQMMGRYPAVLSAMQNENDEIVGLHQIYLDPATGGKLRLPDPDMPGQFLPAKKMRGTAWGCSIRLGMRGAHMGASEGIENGLVYMAEAGRPVWAAGSLNNLAGPGIGAGVPRPDDPARCLPTVFPDMARASFALPDVCVRAAIIQDSDSKDPLAAACLFERAARRHALLKKEVSYIVPPAGLDLNDVVMGVLHA